MSDSVGPLLNVALLDGKGLAKELQPSILSKSFKLINSAKWGLMQFPVQFLMRNGLNIHRTSASLHREAVGQEHPHDEVFRIHSEK